MVETIANKEVKKVNPNNGFKTYLGRYAHAVKHIDRRKVFALIKFEGRINVTQMYVKLRTYSQCEISQALAILRRAGAVIAEREGKEMYYTVNEDAETLFWMYEETIKSELKPAIKKSLIAVGRKN